MEPRKRPSKTERHETRAAAKADFPSVAQWCAERGWSLTETPGWCDYTIRNADNTVHVQLFPASGLKGYLVNRGDVDLSQLQPCFSLMDAVRRIVAT